MQRKFFSFYRLISYLLSPSLLSQSLYPFFPSSLPSFLPPSLPLSFLSLLVSYVDAAEIHGHAMQAVIVQREGGCCEVDKQVVCVGQLEPAVGCCHHSLGRQRAGQGDDVAAPADSGRVADAQHKLRHPLPHGRRHHQKEEKQERRRRRWWSRMPGS
jgi:hypothetical protein